MQQNVENLDEHYPAQYRAQPIQESERQQADMKKQKLLDLEQRKTGRAGKERQRNA